MTDDEAVHAAKQRWGKSGWAGYTKTPGIGKHVVGDSYGVHGNGDTWEEAFECAPGGSVHLCEKCKRELPCFDKHGEQLPVLETCPVCGSDEMCTADDF